ncbi:MAG TPA: excinuclease ABC subunit UvrA [Planctomycetaceae bacterium]|nr:excinuclease ABC subunit UvrA [Planctomycetaceae bacterium]
MHNLKNIDLDVPLGRMIVLCGVSGSGKSSLAFDTLYAEGQRRYIDTFSPYVRQFLDRIPRPDADRIEPIPPAIAVRQAAGALSVKSTLATATEIHDALRLLYARVGRVVCAECGAVIQRDTPQAVAAAIQRIAEGTRIQICFPRRVAAGGPPAADGAPVPVAIDAGAAGEGRTEGRQAGRPSPREVDDAGLRGEGFSRVIVGGRTRSVGDLADAEVDADGELWVVVDRIVAGRVTAERIHDSLETAFRHGGERCLLLTSVDRGGRETAVSAETARVDEGEWHVRRFNAALRCETCGVEFAEPEPRLFSFNAPLGACPECHGFGRVPAISLERVVPDPAKSLREGAIAPWTTPAYRHELDELLALAGDYGIPADVPFAEHEPEHVRLIRDGVPERDFGGLTGFFRWLERHRYEVAARIALVRWRSYETCSACDGGRLQPLALAVRVIGRDSQPNIAELCRWDVARALTFCRSLREDLADDDRAAADVALDEIQARLEYLEQVGLGYLTLDRPIRTLSGGEARRVALTAALGSRLVNTLYVLDEPSAGLHPRDSRRVIDAIRRLRDAGNTVVVVEHEDEFIRAADHVVEIGPGAGREGGRVVFQGTPGELAAGTTITAQHLARSEPGSGSPPAGPPPPPRPPCPPRPPSGWLRLVGACAHNLRNITVEFPLGVLCVVAGPSGSGKSTLVEETLYPALCRHLRQPCGVEQPGPFEALEGFEAIDQVVLADPSPIGHSSRSNAATYLKAFDEIRKVFAETPDARGRNLGAAAFSFNSPAGGRCPKCLGTGTVAIDMQFLADVTMTCPECGGRRYRGEILDVTYRGCSIADVLDMTLAEAFTFFRTRRSLLRRLKPLKDVGLDYLPLGQPATTLSGGESQRLKLARLLSAGTRARTLFVIDEPTTGLHPADIERLLVCFDELLEVGHSLVVVEHNADVIRRADHVIELGPGAGAEGGAVVAAGAAMRGE